MHKSSSELERAQTNSEFEFEWMSGPKFMGDNKTKRNLFVNEREDDRVMHES